MDSAGLFPACSPSKQAGNKGICIGKTAGNTQPTNLLTNHLHEVSLLGWINTSGYSSLGQPASWGINGKCLSGELVIDLTLEPVFQLQRHAIGWFRAENVVCSTACLFSVGWSTETAFDVVAAFHFLKLKPEAKKFYVSMKWRKMLSWSWLVKAWSDFTWLGPVLADTITVEYIRENEILWPVMW